VGPSLGRYNFASGDLTRMRVAIDVVAKSHGRYVTVLYGRGTGAAHTTLHVSWTELALRLERVLSVSPERTSQMESELMGGGTAETGPFEVSLEALRDFGFLVD
jgi:hypothetical protein